MPATITNLDGIVFKRGFLYLTRDGGSARAVAAPALQNISLNHSFDKVYARGPESLAPLAVGIAGESLTGSAESMVFTPELILTIMGGSQAFDGTYTTYTKKNTEEPRVFDLDLWMPEDGSDMIVRVYRCIGSNFRVLDGNANREFNTIAFDFEAVGKTLANGAALYDIRVLGNQTGAS